MAGRFESRQFTKANIEGSGLIPKIPKETKSLTEKKAPPEIAYGNPLDYLTMFQSNDGKVNLVAIGGVIVAAWLLLRWMNK